MALDVIGSGFPRNGTMSLRAAFVKLGYAPNYHMAEIVPPRPGFNDGHIEAWADFIEGTRRWTGIGCFSDIARAVTSRRAPRSKELADAFPDARVVHTVRDPEAWYASYSTLMRVVQPILWAGFVVPRLRHFRRILRGMESRVFGATAPDRDACLRAYERHNDEVRRTIPADRLLVFEVKEGWGPLCSFLGCPVPDEPFPHVNEGEQLPRLARSVLSKMVTGRWNALRQQLDEL